MKKIKITEQQANMLKNLGKTKVLKITKEQYDRILEFEKVNEFDLSSPVERGFHQNLSRDARKDFQKTKIPGITEMYEAFINELYGITESDPVLGESNFKKLAKLMESCGLIKNNRIAKDRFNGDKNVVKTVIAAGLYELANGGSKYSALELMENALDLSKDMPSDELFKGLMKQRHDNKRDAWNQRNDGGKYPHGKFDDKKPMDKYKSDWLDRNRMEETENNGNYEMDEHNYKHGDYVGHSEPNSGINKVFDVLLKIDSDTALMEKGGELYVFVLPDETEFHNPEYVSVPGEAEDSEDGWNTIYNYDDVDVDEKAIELYVNDNLDSLSMGVGISGYEDGYDIVKIDDDLKSDLYQTVMKYSKDEHTKNTLKQHFGFNETTTSVAVNATAPIGKLNDTTNQPNVADEIDGLITDETEVDTQVDNSKTYQKVVDLLGAIINSPAVIPNTIEQNADKLEMVIGLLSDIQYASEDEKTIYGVYLPRMIKHLIYISKAIEKPAMFDKYIHQIRNVFNTLKSLKKDLYAVPSTLYGVMEEQGIGSVGAYDTPGFASSEFMGTKGKDGKAPVKTSVKPYMKGAQEVKVKDKCKKFPYCDQGPDAIEGK